MGYKMNTTEKNTDQQVSDTETGEEKKDWGHIKSFVHRSVHMTPKQRKALEGELFQTWCLPYQAEPLNYEKVFGRSAPTVLEIGFGMGETSAKIAHTSTDKNFIGVEVFSGGVGALLNRIDEESIPNIRIIQHDAVDVVNNMLAPNSLDGVHIYFPDPWQKKRHFKRRMIQRPRTDLMAKKLSSGGYLYFVTDWFPYAEFGLEQLTETPGLHNKYDKFAPHQEWRPETKFERKGLDQDRVISELMFIKD